MDISSNFLSAIQKNEQSEEVKEAVFTNAIQFGIKGIRKSEISGGGIEVVDVVTVAELKKQGNECDFPKRKSLKQKKSLSPSDNLKLEIVSKLERQRYKQAPEPMIARESVVPAQDEPVIEQSQRPINAPPRDWSPALYRLARRRIVPDPRFATTRIIASPEFGFQQIPVQIYRNSIPSNEKDQDCIYRAVRQRNRTGGFISTQIADALAANNISFSVGQNNYSNYSTY